MSGIDSISSRVGKYIANFLQPLVSRIPSFIKDTKHVINLLSNISPKEGLWMVTADVSSLYTIIPHHLGFQAVELFLIRDSGLPPAQINFIMELLYYAASHNYFWLENQFYRQDRGVAMRAKYAPSLANLFMAKWEEDVVDAPRRSEVLLWARYINDILLLWDGCESELQNFMTSLNDNNRGIRFNFEASRDTIHFLDLKIQIVEDHFVTSTHFKVTDRNSYILVDSCHHEPWLRAIPQGQFLRLRRNCSDITTFDEQASILMDRFIEKGYDRASLSLAVKTARDRDRLSLLSDIPQHNAIVSDAVPFITTYSVQHRDIKQLIQKHWHLLGSDRVLSSILPVRPRVVFRGVASLGSKVAPSVQDPPCENRNFLQNLTGYYKCGRCQVCSLNANRARRITQFTSTSTLRSYDIKPFITCTSVGVVYLLQCPCGLQDVGRTKRALWVRLNEHIGNIKRGYDKHPVSRHYDQVHNRDPSNTLFVGIDKYKPHWRGSLLVREISKSEMSWIHRLKSYVPRGMNVDVDVNAFINNS